MKKELITIIAISLCVNLLLADSSKLDSFEKGTSTKPKSNSTSKSHHKSSTSSYSENYHDDDPLSSCIGELFFETSAKVVGIILVGGGVISWDRINPGTDDAFESRRLGEPLIPFLRFDFSYQDVVSDLEAYDYRLEGGYGPFAIHFNQTHYKEKSPSETLDLIRLYGLYRMSFGPFIEIDLGFGSISIDGDAHDSDFSFTAPVLLYLPNKSVGVEFRPAWSENISDYDIALVLSQGYSSIKLGYRSVKSPGEKLDGPYAGLSFHF